MKKYIIPAVIVVVALIIVLIPKQSGIGGAFGQPGLIDLGTSGVASSSFSAVGGTAVKVLNVNLTRAYARCDVTGAGVFLGLSSTASKSWGPYVPASSSYSILANTNLYRGAVWAISNGTARVSCIEH